MWNTLLLTGTALIFATLIGVALGVVAARRPYSATDNAITTVGLLGYSMPVFWAGQILILLFAVKLGWLPAQGMKNARLLNASGFESVIDEVKHLILPALALSFNTLAVSTRITRASMLEVMDKEFIITARAKGVPERTVRVKHALRNALIPVVTVFGFQAGFVFAGSALVETVFGWPGIGRLLFESVLLRDYPVLMGVFLLTSVTVLIMNLLTDIAYGYLDPRIRM
jgi:peptide/nickel transport system permease protein